MLVGVVRLNTEIFRREGNVVPMLVGVVREYELILGLPMRCPHARGGGPSQHRETS